MRALIHALGSQTVKLCLGLLSTSIPAGINRLRMAAPCTDFRQAGAIGYSES
jgi:hypothetical protein